MIGVTMSKLIKLYTDDNGSDVFSIEEPIPEIFCDHVAALTAEYGIAKLSLGTVSFNMKNRNPDKPQPHNTVITRRVCMPISSLFGLAKQIQNMQQQMIDNGMLPKQELEIS